MSHFLFSVNNWFFSLRHVLPVCFYFSITVIITFFLYTYFSLTAKIISILAMGILLFTLYFSLTKMFFHTKTLFLFS